MSCFYSRQHESELSPTLYDRTDAIVWSPSPGCNQSDDPHVSCGDWVSAFILHVLKSPLKATTENCLDAFRSVMEKMHRLRQSQIDHFRPWLALLIEADMMRAKNSFQSLVSTSSSPDPSVTTSIPVVVTPCALILEPYKCLGCIFCRTRNSTPLGSMLTTLQFNNLVNLSLPIEPNMIDTLIASQLDLMEFKTKVRYLPLIRTQQVAEKLRTSFSDLSMVLIPVFFNEIEEYILFAIKYSPQSAQIFTIGSDLALHDKERLKTLYKDRLTEYNLYDTFPNVPREDMICCPFKPTVKFELRGDIVTSGAIALLDHCCQEAKEFTKYMEIFPELILRAHAQFRTKFLSEMLSKADPRFLSDLPLENDFKSKVWGPLNAQSPVGTMTLKTVETASTNKIRYSLCFILLFTPISVDYWIHSGFLNWLDWLEIPYKCLR